MITLTISAGMIFYLGGCTGFIIGVAALWLFVEVWKFIQRATAKQTGKHRRGARRDGNPDRYVYMMCAGRALCEHIGERFSYG